MSLREDVTVDNPAYRYARFFTRDIRSNDLATINTVLDRYPTHLLDLMHEMKVTLYVLAQREKYRDASRSLRRLGVDVDAWPLPPAGLTVVEERTVYLRSVTPMTVSHELNHALDLSLGGGVYYSGHDASIRGAFARARDFVTPYAATGLDEWWSESARAYVEVNDSDSPWPKATRARLKSVDPVMYGIIERIFTPPVAVEPKPMAYQLALPVELHSFVA